MTHVYAFITLLTEKAVDVIVNGFVRKGYTLHLHSISKTNVSVVLVLDLQVEKATVETVSKDLLAIVDATKVVLLSYVLYGEGQSIQWGGGRIPEYLKVKAAAPVPTAPDNSPLGRMDAVLKDDP